MSPILPTRASVALAVVVVLSVAGAARAANVHRAVTTSTSGGSGGATSYLQTSTSGSALQGEVGNTTNTGVILPFGVLGEYNPSGMTFGTGVLGISTTGYAVGAESLGSNPSILALGGGSNMALEAITPSGSATAPAVYVESDAMGPGIEAVAGKKSGPAIVAKHDNASSNGSTDYIDAMYAETTGGRAAIEALANGNASQAALIVTNTYGGKPTNNNQFIGASMYSGQGPAIFADSGGTSSAVFSNDVGGNGIEVQGTNTGVGVSAFGSDVGVQSEALATTGYPTVGVAGTGQAYGLMGITTGGSNSYPLYLGGSSGEVAYVDDSGALYVKNGVHTFARTRDGFSVESYTARSSAPTVEDTGEGRLVNGSAVVRIDPAVAQSLDTSSAYHVFLTPEADTNGLYVTQKTASTFVVHETRGGHGTFAFDYRIVGAVDGQAHTRMMLTNQRRMEDTQPPLPHHHALSTHTFTRPKALNPTKPYTAPPIHQLITKAD